VTAIEDGKKTTRKPRQYQVIRANRPDTKLLGELKIMQVLSTLLRIGGWLSVAGATCALLVAGVSAYFTHSFKSAAIQTDGVVINLLESNGSDGGTMYSPVFAFSDQNGETHEIHSSFASYPPSHSKGEKVIVYYPSDAPKNAKLDGFFSMWGLAVIAGICSVSNYVMGLVFLLIARSVRPKAATPPPLGNTQPSG
jgi:hypothetical protein